jgi:copper chaperone
MKKNRWMPFVMIGVMLLGMLGVMAMFSLMLGEINPTAMMYSSSGDMWTFMLVPFLGLLVMVAVMFFGFRWMTGRKGLMSKMMGTRDTSQFAGEQKELNTMTFHVPDVNCAHCKMKIENEVGNLPGVTSVIVDVDARQAVVKLISPPTKTEIETLLTEIGYPPEIRYNSA